MTALLVVETIAVLGLAVLVAGLLRSHAEILRRLHDLGAGYGEEAGPGSRAGATSPVSLGRTPAVAAITGLTPIGEGVSIAMGRPGERTLILFLSSGCSRCQRWWDALQSGAHRTLGARIVAVGRDADEESPAVLGGLAPADVSVVLSSEAWSAYRVPGSPYAVYVGEQGEVVGEGTATAWDQLISLLTQAGADARSGPEREARADRELAQAGILPGDASLHPPVAP
jgi:hypothetical protein